MDQLDYLPLSMLNQLEYCERRFYLMYVCGEMEINAAVLDGTLRHERVHQAGTSSEGETISHRRVYVWSERLKIAGYADLVEETSSPDAGGAQNVTVCPVEYKRGRMGRWLNDHVQLCAQALCLEENLPRPGPIELGYIFYFGSRRREQVAFTPELRARTEQAVRRAFELAAGGLPLPAEKRAKCRDCSLQPACLPFETDVWAGRATPRRQKAGHQLAMDELDAALDSCTLEGA